MRDTILARFAAQAAGRGDDVALRTLVAGGAAADATMTWAEWAAASRQLSAALVAAGVAPGERVAVLAGNRPLWPIADLGVLAAGAVSVGVYPTSAPAQVASLLADADARVVIVDRAEHLDAVLAARAMLPKLRVTVCEDADAAAAAGRDGGAPVVSWKGWLASGARALEDAAVRAELDRRLAALAPDDLAVLIYTSGSTGVPKGACLSHRYLLASAESVRLALGLTACDTTLSFLPFSHAAERIFGLCVRVHCGIAATLVEDHHRVWEVARLVAPTLFGGLPRFYEKASAALRAAQAAASPEDAPRWARALELGRARARLRREGRPVPEALEREWAANVAPARTHVAALFGDRLRVATSGGATLPVAVAEHLDALGVTVLGAYGLTEHLCVAMNRPARHAFDTVGPLMPGTEARIAGDGELLVRRGPLTFTGYLNRPQETREAFTADGCWLRTGDLATLGDDGFLRVTGRAKELIALSSGKKVAPLPIEARLSADEWIAQAVLVGEGRSYVSALLALRRPAVEAWAAAERIGLAYPALLRHPAVRARVQQAVDRVNAELSRPEQVKRFALLERELTVERGELTPTLKVRRAAVAASFAGDCAALYDSTEERA
jgi:long-chain acyl-CoA synthetase